MSENIKDEEEKEVIPSNLVLYIGQDASYFSDLETKYKELYPNSPALFNSMMADDDSGIQSLILEIRRLRPKMIFIDYSTHTDAMLHITRVWLRQNFHTTVGFIGLCDYAHGESLVKKSVMTALKCVHIKSTEFEAICFDIHVLAFPDLIEDHGFATAKLSEPFKVFIPCKLTNISPTEMRVESDVDLSSAAEINFKNFLIDKQVLVSPRSRVVRQETENLYYNFQFAQYLEPILLGEVETTDDMTDAQYKELEERNKEIAEGSRRKLEKWVKENKQDSKPKFIKTLVVDKKDSLFDDQPMSDSYNYVFRTQAYLKEIKQELLRVKPNIIVFQLEKVSEEELSASEEFAYSFNTGSVLLKIIQVIQNKGAEYQPYIIAFNTIDKSTAMLQKTFNYQNIIGVHEPIQVELVEKMCNMLRAKVEPEMMEFHREQPVVILGKNDVRTYAEFESEVTVKAISESDIYFDSSEVIPMGTVFRINIIENFFVTVMPMPGFAKQEAEYFGIIHGIGEKEKPGIRQFINNIFFQDKQQKKAEEAKAVEAQKQKYLEEKEAERLRELEEQKALEEGNGVNQESSKAPSDSADSEETTNKKVEIEEN